MTVQQSDAASVIRRVLRPKVTPDQNESVLDLDLTEYQCPNCRERCINPCDSVLAKVGVCFECHVQYTAFGHVEYIAEPRNSRASQSEETEDGDPDGDRSPTEAERDTVAVRNIDRLEEVYHTGGGSGDDRTLHSSRNCRYLGAAVSVYASSLDNLPRGRTCSNCFADSVTRDDLRDEPGDADE